LSLGISTPFKTLFLSLFFALFLTSCSKTGEIFGIDIPKDNVVDNAVNDAIYYPVQEQMCSWGFRSSGCEEETTTITSSSSETNKTTPIEEINTTCQTGFTLVSNICVPTSNQNSNKLKDITSKWYDILTEAQQLSIQKDKNNLDPNNKDLTILTLLDIVPKDGLKMLKDTKVSLPYYIFNKKVDTQLAYVESSDKSIVSPHIIDSSNGAFKVIDSNSILFLELEAKGEVNQSASVSLKVQQEDATKFDKESLKVSIVENNQTYTYNPVSLFFTYNTIIIEENDSRNIYFGISYTIDSNVTVVVRSDLEQILADQNKTLDLQNIGENNNIISAFVSNENGVPFNFRLDAKGKAGDTMELFLVAIDNHGKYDYKKFNVLIVAKGKGDYTDTNSTTTPDNSKNPTISGDNFETLNETQKALVNSDHNNYDTGSSDKPIITIFNPEKDIKLHKGESLTTSFYVKDLGKDTIYTNVYDDIKKVTANMENYGKYTITHSNKFFFLTLEAVGEVGDTTNITIRSQNANDEKLFDQEGFKVTIVADDVESSYIEPLIYLGFKKLYIEEDGERTGLQFAIAHSKTTTPNIVIADESVAKFDKWITKNPPKFSIKATGRSGSQTTMTITANDGIKTDERTINIYIIQAGQLKNYIDKEKEADNNSNVKTCEAGQHLENDKCVVDKIDPTCQTGETLINGKCISDSTGGETTPTCTAGQHLDTTNKCVPDSTDLTCDTGFTLKNGKCISDSTGDPTDPTCTTDYHIENGICVPNEVVITCDTGFTLKDGKCISDLTGEITEPICDDNYHIENNKCIANIVEPICDVNSKLVDGKCISDSTGEPTTPTCEVGFHIENNQCVTDNTDPTCNSGYHLSGGECIADDGKTDPIPPMCQNGYNLKNGVCVISLVCETGYHIDNEKCIINLPNCETGFHLENSTCILDKNTTVLDCGDLEHEENGICVDNANRDNLDSIPYSEWTENEKNAKSVEICTIKMDSAGFKIIEATAVTAEGFANSDGTIILHTTKTPIINGITQNVTLKLIYQEVNGAVSTNKVLDSTFRLPKFRVDYTVDYAGKTFYIIDESNGKCFINVFPNENSIPFGILDIVTPDGVNGNF